jgi:hypothetical protein
MNFGLTDNIFYIDVPPSSRPNSNMRDETELRAEEIYTHNNKILLSLSSGLDSQSVLHSFHLKGIPFEAVFLYLPGYNDIELTNLKILERKYNFKTRIVDIDPLARKEEIEHQSVVLDCNPLAILHKIFLDHLPTDHDFVQMAHDPFVFINAQGQKKYVQSYYDMEISKIRAFDSLNRTGQNIMYGSTSEFLLSIIGDDIYRAAINSYQYFDGNGLNKDHAMLTTVDRYDYYIKPLLYGKYWGNELIYFPKYVGIENINFLNFVSDFKKLNRCVIIAYDEFLTHLGSGTSTKRYYQFKTYD